MPRKVGYIAPEQARAEQVDRRADIWSVGVVLWEALTGTRLFKAESDAATLGLTLQGPIPSAGSRRDGIPEELEAILSRALERDPTVRYQTAGAMRKDLEGWLARAGFSRDARVLAALMKDLFITEITEQKRLVSALMARSDCTPPAPASNRSPSSTSALYLKVPSPGATSADLTRINDQMEELGKRHRRAFRTMFALIGAFLLMACLTVVMSAFRSSLSARNGSAGNLGATHPIPKPLATVDPPPSRRVASPAQAPSPETTAAAPTAMPSNPNAPEVTRVVAPPVRPVKMPIAAKASEAAPLPLAMPSTSKADVTPSFGFLTIDTSPWSVVSAGGKLLGQTPLIGVKLPAGSHVLSLKNPEQGIETSYPVTIEVGKTTVRRIGIE